jgi:hydroxymethylglutaryl-CoA lyase
MAFGNPYGDLWNADIAVSWVQQIKELGIQRIALSDTIGIATSESITYLFTHLIQSHPDIEFGAHFHTTPETWKEKIDAAYLAGCTRFDGAIFGFGGCPMAKDELTGNMPSEKLVEYFLNKDFDIGINIENFEKSKKMALNIFNT